MENTKDLALNVLNKQFGGEFVLSEEVFREKTTVVQAAVTNLFASLSERPVDEWNALIGTIRGMAEVIEAMGDAKAATAMINSLGYIFLGLTLVRMRDDIHITVIKI